MDNDNKNTSGAPSSDTTSALFVSARKKQIEQQEAERLAKEKEEKRLAAEAEVRRLEAEVEARKRKAEEDARAAEAEARRIAEESKAKIAAAEAAAKAAAAAPPIPAASTSSSGFTSAPAASSGFTSAPAASSGFTSAPAASSGFSSAPSAPAASSGFSSAPAASSGFSSAPAASSGFSSAPSAPAASSGFSSAPAASTPAPTPAPAKPAPTPKPAPAPKPVGGAVAAKPLNTKMLMIIGGAVLAVILIVVIIVVAVGGSGDDSSSDRPSDRAERASDEVESDDSGEFHSVFAELSAGETRSDLGDMDGLDDSEQFFYDDYLGLEFYYPNGWSASALKADDETPFDTVTVTPEDNSSLYIDVSDCTMQYWEFVDSGETDFDYLLTDYIIEMAETYGDEFSNFAEFEYLSSGPSDFGAETYVANWYTDDSYAYSGLAVLMVDEDMGTAVAMYLKYDVNIPIEDVEYAKDMVVNSLHSYSVG